MNIKRILCLLAVTSGLITYVYAAGPKDKPTPEPWAKWTKAAPLEGGAGLKLSKLVPAFEKWFSSTIKSAPLFYTINVSKNSTYEIYWDDKSEGSKKYTGDVVFWLFKMDGKTKYDTKDKGYSTPITLKAAESTINIVVTSMSPGSFAFGIRKIK